MDPWDLASNGTNRANRCVQPLSPRRSKREHRTPHLRPGKDEPARRLLGEDEGRENIDAAPFGDDGRLLVVRQGVATVEDAVTGKVESSLDLNMLFGVSSSWRAVASADGRAAALWHVTGIIVFKTAP